MFIRSLRRFGAALLCMMAVVTMYAQTTPAQPATTGKFTLFFEKVFLHTDRSYYAAGEDLWFKAYLVNGQTNYLTNTSNNLYVELITPTNEILMQEVIRLDKGEGHGDFKLIDSIAAGRYRLRAYTNWMRNFGNMFVFEKEIRIASPVTATAGKRAAETLPTPRISFFPEGGALVNEVASLVTFKIEDATGKAIAGKGRITTSNGREITGFHTEHAGMGSFQLKPEPGLNYKASVQLNNGQSFSQELPPALKEGLALQLKADDDALLAVIHTNAATLATTGAATVTIGGKHGGKFFFEDTITLKGVEASIRIPKQHFPAGIASITLYDEKGRPNCERLVYIDQPANVSLTIHTNKTNYAAGELVNLAIEVRDTMGKAAPTHLSVAVVDAAMIPGSNEDIVSYLLLQSEIKGVIDQPGLYFNKQNSNRLAQLDLLLRAQGWRDFIWRRVKDSAIVLRYLPEPGITLSGKVKRAIGNKPVPGMNITLRAPDAKGNKIYFTKTDSAGRYYLDGLPLYGTQQVKLSSRNDKAKEGGYLLLDSLFNNHFTITPATIAAGLPDTAVIAQRLAATLLQRKETNDKQNTLEIRNLEGVTVTYTKEKSVVLSDGAYIGIGNDDSTFHITPQDYKDYELLNNFLVHRKPGVVVDPDSEGVLFQASGQKIRPRFMVDKKEDIYERMDYYTLPMTVIETVTIRHMLSAAGADVYLIYLRLKPEAFERKDLNLINTTITGYYEARTFYQPVRNSQNNKNDLRTTLYWNPDAGTGATHKSLNFYNAGNKGKVNVVVQGLTEKGEPIYGISSYQVQ